MQLQIKSTLLTFLVLNCYTFTYLYIQNLWQYLYSALAITVLDCGHANKVLLCPKVIMWTSLSMTFGQ